MNQSIKINKWTVKGKTPEVAAELVPTAIKRQLCTRAFEMSRRRWHLTREKVFFSFHTAALVSLSPSMDRLFGLDQNKSVQGFRSNFTDFRGISQSYQIILDLCFIYLLIFFGGAFAFILCSKRHRCGPRRALCLSMRLHRTLGSLCRLFQHSGQLSQCY